MNSILNRKHAHFSNRILSIIVLIITSILACSCTSNMPQTEAAPTQAVTAPPILRPGDLSEFGTIIVMIPDQVRTPGEGEDFLSGWDESHLTAFGIVDADGKPISFVFSLSYKYSSAEAAKSAASVAQESALASIQKKDADALSDAAVASLNNHPVTWNVWQGIDHEGWLAYFLLVQSGQYVNLIEINGPPSAAESAQKLLDSAAVKVSSGNVGAALPASATVIAPR